MKRLNMTFPELPYSMEQSLKRLQINVAFSGYDTKKILITSSVPNEGKSLISVQLWKMLAEAGNSAVFVDLDFRNSALVSRHSIRCEDGEEPVGLDFYLSGKAELEEVVYSTNVENGDFVPCTNLLKNPSSLFEDRRFAELLNKLAESYRYVIIDSAPLENVADGNQIAPHCDGAILVVRCGYVSRKIIRKSLQTLQSVGCRLLGAALNREEKRGKFYGRYYGGDGYGYGGYGTDGQR